MYELKLSKLGNFWVYLVGNRSLFIQHIHKVGNRSLCLYSTFISSQQNVESITNKAKLFLV